VIDLVVAHLLMEAHPSRSEGELSKIRATIVNEHGLAETAAELGLGEWLFLGRGEELSGGRKKPSLLADACEALIAAVYLDGGFDAAFRVVRSLFFDKLKNVRQAGATDFKTRLQERAAQARLQVRYQVVAESGPDHDKTFEVAVFVGENENARGNGKTKKEAEQRAAESALSQLGEPDGKTQK
jgi:ribonuclease-3